MLFCTLNSKFTFLFERIFAWFCLFGSSGTHLWSQSQAFHSGNKTQKAFMLRKKQNVQNAASQSIQTPQLGPNPKFELTELRVKFSD